jgi:hypothetical protein
MAEAGQSGLEALAEDEMGRWLLAYPVPAGVLPHVNSLQAGSNDKRAWWGAGTVHCRQLFAVHLALSCPACTQQVYHMQTGHDPPGCDPGR